MKENEVAILDIGSSKITCYVASKCADGFIIKAAGSSKYAGYQQGEWLEPNKIKDAIALAISQAGQAINKKIKSVFIGVPGEFTAVTTSEASNSYMSKKKITKDDIMDIFNKANIYGDIKDMSIINRSSIYYVINDSEKVADPLGKVATKLTGLVSFVFIANYFKDFIGKVMRTLGVAVVDYVSSCLAEALYLIEPSQRDNFAVLIDVGYLSSSVMLVGGDGLVFLRSFSLGSGFLAGDLCQVLNIEFSVAEQLLTNVNLNLDFTPADTYAVKNSVDVEARKTNEIVKARLEDIARFIVRCFERCEFEIPSHTPVLLTGGGLSYLKGATEYLTKVLSKPVKVVQSKNPLTNRHELATSYGLLDIAVRQSGEKRGFFKFFKKF